MLVKDQFRKNGLSLAPGGSTLTAITKDGREFSYDKIKNVDAYCRKLASDLNVIEIMEGTTSLWKRNN
jgi:hypothetical protein